MRRDGPTLADTDANPNATTHTTTNANMDTTPVAFSYNVTVFDPYGFALKFTDDFTLSVSFAYVDAQTNPIPERDCVCDAAQ